MESLRGTRWLAVALVLGVSPSWARQYVTGYFDLQLDGLACGIVRGFAVEGDGYTVTVGLSMGKPVHDWIEAGLASGVALPRSGELTAADESGAIREVVQFSDARITSIEIPAFDGTPQVPSLTFHMLPAAVKRSQPGGSLTPVTDSSTLTGVRVWLDGVLLDGVGGVSAINVRQTVVADSVGMEVADLSLRASGLAAKTLEAAAGGQHSLTVEYHDGGRQLLKMNYFRVGIFKVSRSADETIVDLHVGGVSLGG